MSKERLKVFYGQFRCAHEGCTRIITHFAGYTRTDKVWCVKHQNEARK